ncbi:sugar-binding transcriptional regulator [Candidatus Aerophobetes bacterium]|nr:sugar-binding transcriptional regulator [Candidatus Aerophobetes bacterium]
MEYDIYTKEDLITKIAWLYYKENLTQEEISKQISVSRPKIQRLLQEARESEIVTFQIKNIYANLLSIEKKLVEKYSLKDAVVVPCSLPTDEDQLRRTFAKAGAFYLQCIIDQNKKSLVGLGWGDTISYLAEYFESPKRQTSVRLVSLMGSLLTDVATNPRILVEQIAYKLNVSSYLIWAPAITQDKKTAQAFKSEAWVRYVLQLASKADIILVSIGAFSPSSSLFRMGFLNDNDYKRLKAKGAVSNILGQFFNIEGNLVNDEVHERVISVSLNILKEKSKIVIGVGGGPSKFEGVKGALTERYINVLVTDEETAQKLLRK